MSDISCSTIDGLTRNQTRGHIALALHHYKINRMDANSMELIIFEKAKVFHLATFSFTIFKYLFHFNKTDTGPRVCGNSILIFRDWYR